MKPFVLILLLLFFACNDSSSEIEPVGKDTLKQLAIKGTSSKITVTDTSKSASTILYVWLVDFDNKTKKRNPKFKSEYLNVDTLIKGLNQSYPNIKLVKEKNYWRHTIHKNFRQ